jgi:hypothetical protein
MMPVQERINFMLRIGRYPIAPVHMLNGVHSCRVTPLGSAFSVPSIAPCICGSDCLGWAEMDRRVALRRRYAHRSTATVMHRGV